jgi:ferredoxin
LHLVQAVPGHRAAVFLVADDKDCVVIADASKHFVALREDIEQAARDCPVEVIKIAH